MRVMSPLASLAPKPERRGILFGMRVSRADGLFLIALAILVFSVQFLLLSPLLQSKIPMNPYVSLRLPTITTADYSEYRSTFSCLPTQLKSQCAIRAKYNFVIPSGSANDYGILVADYNGNLEFLVNGIVVDPRGPIVSAQRLMFGLPTLVVFPQNLLKSGTNTIQMTVSSDLPFGALIHQVYIGKASALQQKYSTMYLRKWTIPKQVEGILIAAWIFTSYIVLRHRLKKYYSLFFFLTLICLSIFSSVFAEYFLGIFRILPLYFRLSAAIFIAAILTADDKKSSFVALKYLMLVPLSLFAFFVQADNVYELLIIALAFWAFCIGISINSVFVSIDKALKKRDYVELVPIALAIFAIVINSFNILPVFGIINSNMISLRGYVMVALVVIVTIKIFRTFTYNLVAAQSANDTLVSEVARVRAELDLIYFKDNALKQQMTVQLERERLMGDLHDGLAGNLISINALAEHGKPSVLDEIRRLSKLALLDLRLVVDSLDTFDGELAVAIAAFQERILPQYSGTPIKISWDTEYAPVIATLRPEVNLAIFRILQEAIANAVRHGKANRVHILVRPSKCRNVTASIWILDNGTAAGLFAPGFGMRNMQRRAEKIYGNVYFRLHKDGSAVLLNI